MKKLSTTKGTTLSALLILALAGTTLTQLFSNPFCKLAPGLTSLKASGAFLNPTELYGDWFIVGSMRKFFQEWRCKCSIYHFNWIQKRRHLRAWLRCENQKNYPKKHYLRSINAYNTIWKGQFRVGISLLSWIRFQFWILDVAEDKSWYLIGEPCRKMGILIAKTKSINPSVYNAVRTTLSVKHNYNVGKFIPRCDQQA